MGRKISLNPFALSCMEPFKGSGWWEDFFYTGLYSLYFHNGAFHKVFILNLDIKKYSQRLVQGMVLGHSKMLNVLKQ